MSTAPPRFIARTRAPRVQIDYAVELYGAERKQSLPFVVAVFADLGGGPPEGRPPLQDRKLLEIDVDNFARRLAAIAPRLALGVPDRLRGEGELQVDLVFTSLDDFTPEAVVNQVPGLAALLAERRRLQADADDRGDEPGACAAIDEALGRQLRPILHHPAFRRLEGAWRGLHHLVQNTECSESLKIRFVDVTQLELSRALQRHRGEAWDQSPLFKWLYENEYDSYGGEPHACVVADFHFDHSPASVAFLVEMARICAAAHTPFIAGASLELLDLASRQARRRGAAETVLLTPEYAAWRSLRASEESRYVTLALPRFLARPSWGDAGVPVEAFDFQEDSGRGDREEAVWCNAAYAVGVCLTRAFDLYGWCARMCGVESGGAVEGLPTRGVLDPAGGPPVLMPVELSIDDRMEAELAACGLMPLVHRRQADYAAFHSACTLHEPFVYDSPEASADAQLAARLPHLLACCRFAQHLKCLVRDRVGSYRSRTELEAALQAWVSRYVDPEWVNASEAARAQRPLASAEVLVDEVEGNPGYYTARLYLRPHYQLPVMSTSLRLVTRLPASPLATA